MAKSNVGIKAEKFTAAVAKIMRSYEEVPISEIKRRIECGEYLYECDYIDGDGIKKVLQINDKLTALGIKCGLFEHDRPADIQLLKNLLVSYKQTETEVERDIDREVLGYCEDDTES